MDDTLLQQQLQEHKTLLEKIYKSVEKTRKYFLWTLIITLVTVVLPLIGLAFLLPKYMSMLGGGLYGL